MPLHTTYYRFISLFSVEHLNQHICEWHLAFLYKRPSGYMQLPRKSVQLSETFVRISHCRLYVVSIGFTSYKGPYRPMRLF